MAVEYDLTRLAAAAAAAAATSTTQDSNASGNENDGGIVVQGAPTTPEEYMALGDVMCDTTQSMATRFEALFRLRNGADCASAVQQISRGFADSSALLKHEVAFVLGQMGHEVAVPVLLGVMKNKQQDAMVRHEAGEALGAIGSKLAKHIDQNREMCRDILDEVERVRDDAEAPVVVRETCELAADLIKWSEAAYMSKTTGTQSRYVGIDPAPAADQADREGGCDAEHLEMMAARMMDPERSLFERYRYMFALRNSGSALAVKLLARGFKDKSALFRHEIAYVYGQLQHSDSVPYLAEVLANTSELAMVRHEAAEALGSVGTPDCLPILQQFANDPCDVVRESCIVGIDMWQSENSH